MLLSEGFADCEPGVVEKLQMQGYDMTKEHLSKVRASEDIAKAVGNIEPTPFASASATLKCMYPEFNNQDAEWDMDIDMNTSIPETSTSAMSPEESLDSPVEFLTFNAVTGKYEIQQEPSINLGYIDEEFPSNVDNSAPAPSTSATVDIVDSSTANGEEILTVERLNLYSSYLSESDD
ncbi:uncharacterized protein LOC111069018 [Drosophila obscura]|uniref:uncharacterized protein LOC111069018 n=1 Tax=Drosophila obscura TaxID=7282 RepID=UPI001BB24BA3|nr:uncharacterized protein LOC111069018 [Drosophila obscura]